MILKIYKTLFLGCYSKPIIYTDGKNVNEINPIPDSQILALIELSSYCSQSFSYDCLLAPLTDEGVDYAYWTDRHGDNYHYFTGDVLNNSALIISFN